MSAAATLFAGSDLDREVARLPAVNRAFRYFETAGDAVRTACEKLGSRQHGAFLVQNGTRYDMDGIRTLHDGLTWQTRAHFKPCSWLLTPPKVRSSSGDDGRAPRA